jgi:hypothetical protein
VLCWNYRGYGLSEGTPNYRNLQSDILLLHEWLKTELRVTGPIGVYGRSLGGIAACHLAQARQLDLVIIDRSFSSLNEMAREISQQLYWLYKVANLDNRNDNSGSYLQKEQYKVCLVEPDDQVVTHPASLVYGNAKRIELPSCLTKKETKLLAKAIHSVFEIEDALFVVCNHEAKRFMRENPRLRVNKGDTKEEVFCTVRYDKRSTKAVIDKARTYLSSRQKFIQQ